MKKFVYVMVCFLFISLNLSAQEEEKKNEEKKDEKKESKGSKNIEMVIEGVVTKGKKGFYLKTDMDNINLKNSKEEPDKFKFEDFADKKVKVVGHGRMVKDKTNANFPDRHDLKSITSITLVEDAKPEAAKPEEKK